MHYSFENIKNFIEKELGINTQNAKSKFEPIKERLTHKQVTEKIHLEENGIFFIDSEGNKVKGFLYIEIFDPVEWRNKGWNDVPRFHILNCDIIQKQRIKKNFDGNYVFSNQPVTDVKDADGNENDLLLCSYCKKAQHRVKSVINTTQFCKDFIEPDDAKNNFSKHDLPKEIPLDDYGYTADWDDQSKHYRLKKKFTCEQCGIKLNESYIDGYYLETHHISGIKKDNREENLICLCTLCHANVDEIHQNNFNEPLNKKKLEDFIELYLDRLIAAKNPFIPHSNIKKLQ